MLRQVVAYGVVGVAQLAVEWLVFVAGTTLTVPVPVANVLARVAGASLGFWLNGRFTFASVGARLDRGALVRFIASWCALTVIGTAAVTWLEQAGGLRLAWIGKPVIDVVLAGVGFIASKYWIYRGDRPKGQS